MDLVSTGQIAAMLGVSRQYVQRLARRADFPMPAGRAALGRVWRRADVERWARRNRPTGAPSVAGSKE